MSDPKKPTPMPPPPRSPHDPPAYRAGGHPGRKTACSLGSTQGNRDIGALLKTGFQRAVLHSSEEVPLRPAAAGLRQAHRASRWRLAGLTADNGQYALSIDVAGVCS